MKTIKVLICLISTLLVSSCNFIFELLDSFDEKIRIQQQYYNDNTLRIDGYYYETKQKYPLVYFFYKNGVVYYYYSDSSRIEQDFNDVITNGTRTIIDSWGLFTVQDSIITIEVYQPAIFRHNTIMSKGKIINDSTFVITKTEGLASDNDYINPKFYRFIKTEVKPDSTNSFF